MIEYQLSTRAPFSTSSLPSLEYEKVSSQSCDTKLHAALEGDSEHFVGTRSMTILRKMEQVKILRVKCKKYAVLTVTSVLLLLVVVYTSFHISNNINIQSPYVPRRTDVNVLTTWLAPVIWEGTYDYEILNEQFKKGNHSIGLIIFAIKKYTRFLKDFLATAELYFMQGHRVHYYIFTDRPQDIPNIALKENRFLHVIRSKPYKRWQDILFQRMKNIETQTAKQFYKEVDYLVSTDIDMKFNDHVGVEVLGNLAATIHLGFYGKHRTIFSYERRQISEAYIPWNEGDFYYSSAFYAGTVKEIYLLAKVCAEGIEKDKKKGIEAIWHEESHFNKYLLYHKPTKVLSPEYTWDNNFGTPSYLKKKRFIAVPKNHNEIRN
ncbi:histo-blood group ABO system transferase-like isoform X2 [Protopterus annectens]|uniref:histo-blood group ABO system transferase-like isoform X2 n=1 Tax=Protopterus annectens TaxID=7888 RepID=UPI001CFA7EC4|nr:histo-blood group ABO system transferase-like isoform X2 [Protopterus annectens]